MVKGNIQDTLEISDFLKTDKECDCKEVLLGVLASRINLSHLMYNMKKIITKYLYRGATKCYITGIIH